MSIDGSTADRSFVDHGPSVVTMDDVRFHLIVCSVAIVHDVRVDDILGRSHLPDIVVARHEAMLQVREELRLSYPALGRLFDRDHRTVMHGCTEAMVRRRLRR